MDDKLKAMLDANLCDHPEKNFAATVLAHTAIELEEFIDDFSLAKQSKSVYQWVATLLSATVAFVYSTAAEDMFVTMRAGKSPQELSAIFATMHNAYQIASSHLQESGLSSEDKTILTKALQYSRQCILKSINELSVEDPLRDYWGKSELKSLLIG